MHSVAKCREGASRHFAMALCGGCGEYFYDLAGGRNWYDDPELMATFGELAEVAREAIGHDRTPAAEIALVYDDRGIINYRTLPSWTTDSRDIIMALTTSNREQLGRIGAPFDICLLDDIADPLARPYKLYIFAGTCRMSAERRAEIRQLIERNHATALWLYAPGLFDETDKMDLAAAAELAGCALALDETPHECRLKYADGAVWGGPNTVAPVLLPAGFDEQLAAFAADGAPALVRTGRSFFCATPNLSREAYRAIAEAAGVELFSDDGDAVYHCAGYIAVHSSMRPGRHTLRAPAGKLMKHVWPFGGDESAVTSFIWENDAPQTHIFELVPEP